MPEPTASSTLRELVARNKLLVGLAVVCAALGALLVGSAERGCRADTKTDALEQRVARMEGLLDAGGAAEAAPSTRAAPSDMASLDLDASALGEDGKPACAVAKIAAYRAWQEAVNKAKASAHAAEPQCAELRGEKRRQACYWAAHAQERATQAARDTVIAGGPAAREAVAGVKEDPKNDAIARARRASEASFAACEPTEEL